MNIANRAKSFVFTVYPNNAVQRDVFDELRLIVRLFNRVNGTKFRLQRMGRLGLNNPAILLYRNKVDGRRYQMIRCADAGYFDIYLHSRDHRYNSRDEQYNLVRVLRNWVKLAAAN